MTEALRSHRAPLNIHSLPHRAPSHPLIPSARKILCVADFAAAALPDIIDTLRARGYGFETVTELLGYRLLNRPYG